MAMTKTRWAILEALSGGRPMARRDILGRLGVDKMPGYPFTHLVKGRLIERPAKATYRITDEGRLALALRTSD